MADEAHYQRIDLRYWDDIAFACEALRHDEYPDTHIRFRAYAIKSTALTVSDHGVETHYPRGYESAECWPVGTIEEAEVFIDGSVKWDGCSNFTSTGWHFCEKEQAERVGVLLGRIYDWAKELGMDRA